MNTGWNEFGEKDLKRLTLALATQTGWSRESIWDMDLNDLQEHFEWLFEMGLLERSEK